MTIALIAGGWGIAALLVLRLFASASRADAEERATVAPEGERVRKRRFQPQSEESSRDVAAAGRESS